MTTKYSTAEREEAREHLLKILKPGDTVYTVLRHVSRSGMYRAIDLYVIKDNEPRWLSRFASKLLEGFDDRYEACRASGCGMDMGFHLVYHLASALWPDGFGCIGDICSSNDHVNGDRDYTPHGICKDCLESNHTPTPGHETEHWHNSGGYALKQRWMW